MSPVETRDLGDDDGQLECIAVRAPLATVVELVEKDLRGAGFLPVSPTSCVPFGRWLDGEEDPSLLRFVAAPEAGPWAVIVPSLPDWDHEWTRRLSALLPGVAVHLMLHDGDVFTLHAFDSGRPLAGYASSQEYFDLPPREPGDLGVDLPPLLRAFPEGTAATEVVAALTPAGALDIDGRAAFAAVSRLLGLSDLPAASYRAALEPDGLTLRSAFGRFAHLAYRSSVEAGGRPDGPPPDEPDEPSSAGKVLPFRR